MSDTPGSSESRESVAAEQVIASPPAPRKTRLAYVVSGLGLALILLVASIVSRTTPTEEAWQAGIPVRSSIGESASGRNFTATVQKVRVAESVSTSSGWEGTTTGIWVVVDASVAAIDDDTSARLDLAQLEIDGVLYSASERPDDDTIADTGLTTGINLTGPLMFEIPRAVLESPAAASATISLGLDDDPRLDSVIEVPVDLTQLPIDDSITTDEPILGNL